MSKESARWLPVACLGEHTLAPVSEPQWIFGAEILLSECMYCWRQFVEPTWRFLEDGEPLEKA